MLNHKVKLVDVQPPGTTEHANLKEPSRCIEDAPVNGRVDQRPLASHDHAHTHVPTSCGFVGQVAKAADAPEMIVPEVKPKKTA
ncbi:LOW QUALITY PROTEIN: hypothetical protein IFM46972_11175 [Aspergillus udagawae]|uniref:Uncharacterized protein n=1 Tax=Aspergillus udagawae TaxID=91492 RepID=A0A8H3XRR1_9EURO|nr:LOW QUALITY PROTEIN: hypothetical protein IFM46972_11175 [Aspergillus udagawae]